MQILSRYRKLLFGIFIAVAAGSCMFFFSLRPVDAERASPVIFEITRGESFSGIIQGLAGADLIRSGLATELLSLANGDAFRLKPGLYELNPAMSAADILDTLSREGNRLVTVTIPEGKDIFEIDAILSDALVIHRGDLVRYVSSSAPYSPLEGRLFPDTYQFARGSDVREVVQKFLDDFDAKAKPLLGVDAATAQKILTLASILEKEVPGQDDQRIVAGIIEKRLQAGMYLDIDATVNYGNLVASSSYDTYRHQGLPPGPIGNPGLAAITAALHPETSPYWYYISDPKTGKTIFAESLAEQNEHIAMYLR